MSIFERPDWSEKSSLRDKAFVVGAGLFLVSAGVMGAVWGRRLTRRRLKPKTDSIANSEPLEQLVKTMPSHYEKPQLRGKPFVVGAISFFAFMVLMFVAVWGLLSVWSGHTFPRRKPPAPPAADIRWNTQAPQVQIDPSIDLARLQQTENQRLHALQWNDMTRSYATIPIETAMKMLADASATGRMGFLLPVPQPATPLQLQVQKSGEANPSQAPMP